MILPDFTIDQLKQLPLRAIVAFAVRCARRVEDLAQLPDDHPGCNRRREAVEAALQMAECVASGRSVRGVDDIVQEIDASRRVPGGSLSCSQATTAISEAAHAAATAFRVAGDTTREGRLSPELKTVPAKKFLHSLGGALTDVAALSAYSAAVEAYCAVGYHNESFVKSAFADYERLLRLKLGTYPNSGEPIDPSPDGPLGPV